MNKKHAMIATALIATVLLAVPLIKNYRRHKIVNQLRGDLNSYLTSFVDTQDFWLVKNLRVNGVDYIKSEFYKDYKEVYYENSEMALFPELGPIPCGYTVRDDNKLYQLIFIWDYIYYSLGSEFYGEIFEKAAANGITGLLITQDLTTGINEIIHVFENPYTWKIFVSSENISPLYIAGIENNKIYIQLNSNGLRNGKYISYSQIGEYNLNDEQYKVMEIKEAKNTDKIQESREWFSSARYEESMISLVKDGKYYFYQNINDNLVYCYDFQSEKTDLCNNITINR